MAEKDKDDELVVVTDDPKNLDVPAGQNIEEQDIESGSKEQESKSGGADIDSDEEGEEDDTRLGSSEEIEAEDEAKKKKQSEGKTRRQRRREAEQRLRTEVKFLEGRNDQLERQIQVVAQRQETSDKTNLDQRINQTKSLIRKAEGVMAEAVTNHRGEELTEAQRIRDDLRDQLKGYETKKTREEAEEVPQRPVDPRVVVQASAWKDRNTWFDVQRRDMNSRLVGAIDDAVMSEGFDPSTPDYWKELDRRIAENLPHLKKKVDKRRDDEDDEDDEDDRQPIKKGKNGQKLQQAPGGPKFRTGGPGRDLKSNEVYLSRDRIQALKDADAWDDPVIRAKYLKKYAEYDRDHGTSH